MANCPWILTDKGEKVLRILYLWTVIMSQKTTWLEMCSQAVATDRLVSVDRANWCLSLCTSQCWLSADSAKGWLSLNRARCWLTDYGQGLTACGQGQLMTVSVHRQKMTVCGQSQFDDCLWTESVYDSLWVRPVDDCWSAEKWAFK